MDVQEREGSVISTGHWREVGRSGRPRRTQTDVTLTPAAYGGPSPIASGAAGSQVPRLVCHKCGRTIYTVAPLESLSGDELQCPRCGTSLIAERRETDRRQVRVPRKGRDRRKASRRR